MADYAALPAWQVLAACAARRFDVQSAQTPEEHIQMLHKSDQKRRQENFALDAKYNKLNDWNDPTCVERLELAREILDIRVQRQQTETENLIKHTEEMKATKTNMVDDYTEFTNTIKEDTENAVGDLQREFNKREAILLSWASAVETHHLDHERIKEEYNKLAEKEKKAKLKFDRRRQALEDEEQAFEEQIEQNPKQSVKAKKDQLTLRKRRRRLETEEDNAIARFNQRFESLIEEVKQNKDLKNVQATAKKLQQAAR